MIQAIIVTIIFLLTGAIILSGLVKIKANPPHKGQKTIFGKRIPGEYYNEGWNFLFLYPFYEGFIPVEVGVVPLDVIAEGVRTPDKANSKVPISLAYIPMPELLCQYLDNGGKEGVNKYLTGKIQERTREWAFGKEEGPHDWVELNQCQLEASSILIKRIANPKKLIEDNTVIYPPELAKKIKENTLVEIPQWAQNVPTWIWLRYYAQPRPKNFFENEKDWVKDDWKIIKDLFEEIKNEPEGSEKIKNLEESVAKRRDQINAIRNGTGTIILLDLGIMLKRLNIGDIDVLGKVAELAEKKATEEQERLGEALEIKYVLERIGDFMKNPYNYSAEQALEAVQTERGKVVKNISESKFTISPETRETLENIVSSATLNILQYFTEKGGKN